MLTFFDKKHQKLFSSLRIQIYLLLLLSLSLVVISIFPASVQAHPYSASYSTFKMDTEKTDYIFSIDTLSIIELIDGIDKNNNEKLDQSEVDAKEDDLEELLHHRITLDLNNRQQEPALEKMILEKKEDKNFLTFHFSFPAFSPGDTISFTDGLYTDDPKTNYINLISFESPGAAGTSILQGRERTWTILLTEVQEEQSADGGQTIQPDGTQEQNEPSHTVESTNSSWFSFFKLGMLHILTGYDHLLFLLVLLLRKQSFKQYALIVTSFTIAHSITISLAVLGVVTLPSRFVEAVIAFSIVYVALENIFRKEIRHRWGLTFLFGLIHGLGFANILKEMNIPKNNLAVALFNFNIGIEVVQLILVLLLLPLLTYMFRLKSSDTIIKIGSLVIAALGAIWLFERLFT